MLELFQDAAPQGALLFPESLAEKYRPREVAGFVGLEKPKKIARSLIEKPGSDR